MPRLDGAPKVSVAEDAGIDAPRFAATAPAQDKPEPMRGGSPVMSRLAQRLLARTADRPRDVYETGRFRLALLARGAGEPVARIVGVKEFGASHWRLLGRPRGARPETETVVEVGLGGARPVAGGARVPLRIAGLGTGSGALLLA